MNKKINIKEFLKTMPKECFHSPQNFSDKVEWRMRFFIVDDKKYVEISIKKNNTRKFFDINGNIINYNASFIYDFIVDKEYYFYT